MSASLYVPELASAPVASSPWGMGCCGGINPNDYSRAVLVDVDDTISETQRVLLEFVNESTGRQFTYDGMTRAHREREFAHNDEASIWGDGVKEALKRPEVMGTTEPSIGALTAMHDLRAAGFDPHIVSSRQEPLHEATAQWLDTHNFARYIHRIHPRSGSEKGNDFKVRIAKQERFLAAFDDTFDVAVALAEVVPFMYLIDRPWNRGHDDELPSNVHRVDSFAGGVTDFLKLNI